VSRRLILSPDAYRRVAVLALVALSVIVLTGAAVRLTGSGLGCPDWPRCYGGATPPLQVHALIEWGNRVFSGLVSVAAILAAGLAFRRRPFRRDLAWIGMLLPLGVVAQAVLGGLTVEHELEPGYVMGHYGLSMLVLIASVALAWRASYEPGDRPRSTDRLAVWGVRALLPLGALTIFAGTAATAAGPHAGGQPGQLIHRFNFKGGRTLEWLVHQHGIVAALLGVTTIGVWLLLRRRESNPRLQEAVTVIGVLLAGQGLLGSVQYQLKLPAEMVWLHVTLATVTWVAILWAVAVAGRLTPRRLPRPAADPALADERTVGAGTA
jgi:cytochrome c oxidase assembly protein subunit 15